MRVAVVSMACAVCVPLGIPLAAEASSLEEAIKKNGYQAVLPPTTEGQPGTLYAKVKTTDGKAMPMPVCDLFPATPATASGGAHPAVRPSEEVWSEVEKQNEAGFSFLVSLSKAFKAISGGSASAGWSRVKKTEIEWGPITSKSLVLLDVKQASNASKGSGTYKGAYDPACFDEARSLLAAKQNAFVMAKVAQASSLTAKVELNPAAKTAAAPAKEGKVAAELNAESETTKTELPPGDANTDKGNKVQTAAEGVATKVVVAAGDAAVKKLKGEKSEAKSEAPEDKKAKDDKAEDPTASAGAAKTDGMAAGKTSSLPQPGVQSEVSVDLLDLFKIKAGFGVKQSSSDTLTFAKPMNIGAGYIDVKQMKKLGLLSSPEISLEFTEVSVAEATSVDGAIDQGELEARRKRAGYAQ